jgi:hypothetical protein
MEYDVPQGCSDMNQPSWMRGDRVQEHMLSAGVGRHRCRKRGKVCTFGAPCRIVSHNSIVQMINGQLM